MHAIQDCGASAKEESKHSDSLTLLAFFTFAPAARSALTISVCPLLLAQRRGVQPVCGKANKKTCQTDARVGDE